MATSTEETKVREEDTPQTLMDYASSVWGVPIQRKGEEVAAAETAVSKLEEEAATAKRRLQEAKASHGSFLRSLLEEQKPVRKEDEEETLRRRAIIKGVGDLVGTIASGAIAYGNKGMGIVPTLASSSPLKDIERLNALQQEYQQRKEAWDALDLHLRKAEAESQLADISEEAARANEAAQNARAAYGDAIKGYEEAQDAYNENMLNLALDEKKEANANYRAQLGAAGRHSTGTKDSAEDPTQQNTEMLYAARDFYGEKFAELYLNSMTQELIGGRPIKGTVRTNTIADLDNNDVNAIAAMLSGDPKFWLYYRFPGEFTKEQIMEMTDAEAMKAIERLAGVSRD